LELKVITSGYVVFIGLLSDGNASIPLGQLVWTEAYGVAGEFFLAGASKPFRSLEG
jgi:hypothetical protein